MINFAKLIIYISLFYKSTTDGYYFPRVFPNNNEHQIDDFSDMDTIFSPDDDIITVKSKHDDNEMFRGKQGEDDLNEDKVQYFAQPISYKNSKCELLNVKTCISPDVKYNYTIFPNSHNHKTQTEAMEALVLFNVLIESQCSIYTRLFLCSEFLPMCALRPIGDSNIYVEEALKPCKSLCNHVKNKCEILLLSVGIKWPEILSCERLPEHDMCIRPPLSSPSSTVSSANNIEYEDYLLNNIQSPYESNMNKFLNHIRNKNIFPKSETNKISNKMVKLKKTTPNYRLDNNSILNEFNTNTISNINYCLNRKHFLPTLFLSFQTYSTFKQESQETIKQNINKDKLSQCVPVCNQDILFDKNEKLFTTKCAFVLSLSCFIITSFILLLYMFKFKKFQYPEHIIVTISLCYNIFSIPYIFRYYVGHQKISCENYNYNVNIDNLFNALFYSTPPTTTIISSIERIDQSYVLVKESLENTWCTITFILTYYFQSASTIWWVILTFIWFLLSNRIYSVNLFSKLNSYYHLFAWTVPTLLTIVALVWKRIDADELTGMCSIGNQDTYALLMLVIVPYSVYFFLGLTFIVGGFIGIYKVKDRTPKIVIQPQEQEIQLDGFKTDFEEKINDVYNIINIEKCHPTLITKLADPLRASTDIAK